MRSASRASSGGASAESIPTHAAALSAPSARECAQGRKRVEVRAVVAGEHRRRRARVDDQAPSRDPLVDARQRPELEHHAAPVRNQSRLLGRRRDLRRELLCRPGLGGAPPVERLDRPLVFELDPRPREPLAIEAGDEPRDRPGTVGEPGVEARALLARAQQLEAVVTRVRELGEPDHRAGGERRAPGDAGDESVAARELGQHLRGRRRHRGAGSGHRRSGRASRRRRRAARLDAARRAAARGSDRRSSRL